MVLVKLLLVFLTIILLLTLKRPLWQAILGGLAVTAALYRIAPADMLSLTAKTLTTWSSLQVLFSLYLITFLQRILEARHQIRLAEEDLDRLFRSRRVNVIGACLFIGLLPSAASMILCAELVKNETDGYLSSGEQAFVAAWIRHIPESCLPTYTSVLLMLNLSGVMTARFMAGMLVPVVFLILLSYFTFLRRVPAGGQGTGERKLSDVALLMGHLWPLILIIVLILGFGLQVVTACGISILLCLPVYRITWTELKGFVFSAFEKKLIGNTFLVLVLKEFLSFTGVLPQLPGVLSALPLPTYLVFGLLIFLATAVSGSTASIAMGVPLAFAAIPGGVPLAIYLMGMSHAASMVSPTHVCLVVAADYFKVSLGELIRRTLPFSVALCAFMTLYYNLLIRL